MTESRFTSPQPLFCACHATACDFIIESHNSITFMLQQGAVPLNQTCGACCNQRFNLNPTFHAISEISAIRAERRLTLAKRRGAEISMQVVSSY